MGSNEHIDAYRKLGEAADDFAQEYEKADALDFESRVPAILPSPVFAV